MSSDKESFKRQSIRFEADPNTLVYIKRIAFKDVSGIDSIGLVTTEAGKGFGCITLNTSCPEVDEECIVKVGELHALRAKVVYCQEIDEHSSKLGFQYMEEWEFFLYPAFMKMHYFVI